MKITIKELMDKLATRGREARRTILTCDHEYRHLYGESYHLNGVYIQEEVRECNKCHHMDRRPIK